nr:MAG TPA: chromosome segregation protein [Caudoviricetes sp.]
MKNKKRSTILNNLDDTINTQPISGKEEQRQAQRMSRESILNSIGSMAQGGSGDRSPINAAYEQRQAAREQERWEDYVQQHAGVKRAQQIYARKLEQQQFQNAHRQIQYRRQGVIDRSRQMAAERPEQMARWLRMDADAYERKANDAQRSTRYDRFGRDTGYLGEDAGEYAAQQSLAKEYQSRADAARAQSREVSAYGEQYRRQQQEAARAEQIAEDPAAWMRWAQQQSRAARQRWESRGTDGVYNGATDGIGGGGAQTAADNAEYDEYQRQLKEADDIYRQAYAALREQEAAGRVPTQSSGGAPSARYRTINGQSGEPQPRIIGSRAEGNAASAAITGQRAEAYMSDEQRQTYNYLYATQGEGAAEEYYKLIEPELEQARTQGTQQEFAELSKRAPAAMTLLSTLASPAKIAAGLTSVGDALAGDEINTNSAFYTPVHAISAIRQTVPQVTNWTGDKQIFGQDADSFIYGVITSSLDSALNMALATGLGGIAGGAAGLTEEATNSLVANATSALMGAEMLPDTIIEEKAKGRTDEEATAIAIIRSLIEGVTEKYSIEYFLGDPTTFGKKLGKAFLAEGSEEVASDWLNNIVDVVSSDPENVLQQWRDRVDSGENGALAFAEVVGGMLSEDAASFIAGGISGLGMGAVHEGIRRAGQDKQAYRLGALGQSDAQAVVDEALAINPDSKAAQRAKARLDAGKNVRSVQLGRIMAESDAAILPQEQALAEASRKYGKQAGAMQATYDGEQDVQRYDEAYHVAYEMGRAGTNLKAAQTSMATEYLSQEQRQAAWEAGRDSAGAGSAADIANGRALLGGQIAAVQNISERDGKIYAEILQGTETKRVALEDLKMDAGTRMLAESAKQYGAAAPTIFEQYRKGQQLTQYLRSADMAVSVGMASPSTSSKIVLDNLKSGQLGKVMAAEQIEALYKAGQQAGEAQLRKTGMTRLGTGSFMLEDSAKGTKLDKRQRASLRFLRDLARVTGLDISVYKSASGADGTLMGANGSYVGGRIRVDLNAGAIYEGKLEDASMLRTVSHELTHFMAETAETEFKELQSFLVEKLSAWEGHSIQDLVDEKLAVAKSHGRDISTEEALEEVVADGCEMMLRDSKAIRQLAEENRTLFEKVRDWMTRFFDALRKAFEGVEAVHPESIHMMENYAEELQKLWDDALTAAVKNAKESGQKNSARTGADVRLSVQDGRLTAESTEQERYELLKDVSIRLTSVNEDAVNGVRLEDYNTRKKSAVIPGFRALAKQLGILNVDLQNSEIGFPFQFSGKNLEKSLHHQLEYGGTYQDYIRMMSCFNDLVENAVPIEVHTDKKAGTVRENKNLKQTYVLTSAYRDESSIVPVQLEVKEFHDVGAKLYLDVVLTKIEAEVLGTTSASNAGGPLSLLSASAISLRQIFENVNPADGRFLKYVPDGFLNEAQKDAKAQALRQQEQEYAGYGTKFSDRDYLSAVESGDIETAQKMVEEAAKAAGYTINAYHGTTEQFNVFETPVIFFTDDYMNADGYGNGERVVDAYLRIQNPLVLDAEGAKWDALDTPYGSSTQEIVVNEAVRLEYDGVIFENINDSFLDDEEFGDVSTVYAVFHPEQVKSADPVTYDDGGSVIPLSERFNPRNRDIRFSMRTPVEETRDLIAVHNLTEENLVSSLDIGGLPSPSIAIIKAGQGHSKYGPISIVFDKSTIDPQADSRNKIYGSDAWTPTVPRVEYQVNSKMLSQIERELHRLAGDTSVAGGIFGNSSALRSMGIDDTSNLNRKQLAEKLASTDTVRAAYLADQGQMLEPMKMDKVWDKFGNDTLQKVIDRLGVDTLAEMEANLEVGESAENALGENAEVIRDILRDYYRKQGEPMLRRMAVKKHWTAAEISEKRQTRIENSVANVSVFTLEDIVRHAWEMYQDGGNTKGEIDRLATSEALRSAVDDHAVEEWIAGKLDGLLGKAGIYNGKDRYTPSGNSRSFAQLHYDYTLENIVRAMNGLQQARGEGIWGASAESFVAVGTPNYRSIDEVRADKGRLREATEEEYDALKAKLDPMIEEIIAGIRSSNKAHSDNQFEEIDIIGSLLLDAAKGTKTKAAIRSVFRKNGYTVSDALIAKAQSLYREAAKMPTKYFEAKPQRAVSFDEAKAIIVPDNTSAALVQRLEQGGANVIPYKAGDEQARLEALNAQEGEKFSDRDSAGRELSAEQAEAEKRFGTTTDFNEAGFILPDGKMLRFTDDANAGARNYDHRAIGMVYGVDVDLAKNHGFNMESNRHMNRFVEDGGIRFDPGDPDYDMGAGMQLSKSKPLTKAQERTIRDFIAWKQERDAAYVPPDEFAEYMGAQAPVPLTIEFGGGADIAVDARSRDLAAWNVPHLTYEGGQINADRVIADIRHYYETGEVRKPSEVARFRYSERYDGELLSEKEYRRLMTKNPVKVSKQEYAMLRSQAMSRYAGMQESDIPDIDIFRIGDYRTTNRAFEYYVRNRGSDTHAIVKRKKISGGIHQSITEGRSNGNTGANDEAGTRTVSEGRGRGSGRGSTVPYGYGRTDTADVRGTGQSGETASEFRSGEGTADLGSVKRQERDTVSAEIATLQRDIRQMQAELRKLKGTDAQDLTRVAQYDAKEALKAARQDTKVARAEGVYIGKMEQGRAMAKQMSRMEAQKNAQIARLEQRIAETQERMNNRIAEQRQRLKDYRENRNESEAKQHQRKQVEKQLDALAKMLTTNNDKLHVPEGLKQPLKELLQAAMPTRYSKSMTEEGRATKADVRLASALEKIQNVVADNEETGKLGYLDLPPGFRNTIGGMIGMMRSVSDSATWPLYAMNSTQLKELNQVLTTLTHSIRQMNQLITDGHFQSVAAASEASVKELRSMTERKLHFGLDSTAGKAEDVLRNFLSWKNTTPYYAFRRFGEGGQDMFRRLADGWDRLAFNSKAIMDFAENTYTEKEVKAWEKEKHTVTLDSGEVITLSTANAMEFYELSKRQQALGHLLGGGIRVANQRSTPAVLTTNDIDTIIGLLTDRQRVVADKLQEYMELQGSEWGNEVSMKRFGYRYFTEQNYYPVVSDSNELSAKNAAAQENSMYRLLNLSMTKGLQEGANNAIVIGSIFDTFANHMSDMAKYNALALPILDTMKWFNYRLTEKNEAGQLRSRNVRQSIEAAYGSDALAYFTTFMEDLNGANSGGRPRGESFANKMTSNMKVASVAANLRVAGLQATSIARAATVISPKYLLMAQRYVPQAVWHGSGAVFRGRENGLTGEMLQYSGIARWKSLGFFDTNVGRNIQSQIKNAANLKEKVVEKSMSLAELGDTATWTVLWGACKMEQKAKGFTGQELLQKTAERFRDVIYATQVVDSTMTRSHMMRSKNGTVKNLTPFMSEPTLTYNVLLDAAMRIQEVNRKGGNGWKTQSGHLFRAFTAFAMTSALSAIIESLSEAARDDDDDPFLDKFLDALLGEKGIDGNLVQDMVPIGNLPYLNDAVSILQGYSSERMETTWMSKLYNVIQIAKETEQLNNGTLDGPTKITSFGSMTEWGKLYKVLDALSTTVGLPIAAFSREVTSIWNATIGAISPRMKIKRYENKDQKFEWLYSFAQSGSTADYEKELAGLRKVYGIGGKKTEDEITENIQSGMREKIQAHFLDGDISAEEAQKMLDAYTGAETGDAKAYVAKWSCEKDLGVKYDDLKDLYLAGELTDEQAVEYRVKYGLQDEEKAQDTIAKWHYEKETGNATDSAPMAGAYFEYAEPAGIEREMFETAWAFKQNAEGEKDSDGKTISGSVKAQVVEYIQSLGLNRTQAKALWDAVKGDWKDKDTPWA